MGPQDPKDVTRDTARDLSALVGELAALKGDATHWLTDPEFAKNVSNITHLGDAPTPIEGYVVNVAWGRNLA
jgi:hypothetical protein